MNKKIHKIMDLCFEAKTRGHDCFLDYSGHVDSLKFRSYLFGWNEATDSHYSTAIYLNHQNTDAKLDKVIVYLEEIINTDYSRGIKLNYFKRNFNLIMNSDIDYKDHSLSKILSKMELVFSIPAYKDEKFNEDNPDVMEFYQKISNERSIIKALEMQDY